MSRPIVEAGHEDRCGVCDEPIHEGDEIVVVDDEWCHADCVTDELEYDDNYDDECR